MPLAPVRFSTKIDWPRISDIFCPMIRAAMSVPPPAPKPTSILIGRLGYAASWACAAIWQKLNASAAATATRSDRVSFMTFPSLASRAPAAFFSRPNASAEITAQYQRPSPTLIIALAPPDVAEAGAAIQRTRGGVVFVDFKKHGARAEAGQAPQMQIEQRPSKSPSPLTLSDCDREDFRFARRHAR